MVCADGERFMLGVVLRGGFDILIQCHGTTRADAAGGYVAGFVTEDEALCVVSILL